MNILQGIHNLYEFNDLLLQILIVIFPISIYQLFLIEKTDIVQSKQGKAISILFYGLMISLCMIFSISVGDHYQLNLRIIPLTIGFLYVGHRAGSILIAWTLFLSIFLGGYFSDLQTLFAIGLYCPVLYWVAKSYSYVTRMKRIKHCLLLIAYYFLCILVCSIFFEYSILPGSISFNVFMTYFTITLATCFIVINLIENVQEKLKMKEELQNTERMRLLNDLTRIFAHEIRNPMQVTRGFLQLLNDPKLPDHKKEYIRISIEEIDRANMIINDLLTFSKPTTGKLEEVNIKRALLRVINITHTFSNTKNVKIETNLEDNCLVRANPQRLDQCFINIIKNAVESMPDGGIIFVSCAATKRGYIEIKITDQGIGMTEEQIERLGIPNYSLKKNGTGLGMMITFQIIRSYDGIVNVQSEVQNGTTVSISLPHMNKKLQNPSDY